MNAYLVYLPGAQTDPERALTAFVRRLREVGVCTERGFASGVMPFAYLADGGDVANVICRDEAQLLEIIGDLDGVTFLHLGTFRPAHHLIATKASV